MTEYQKTYIELKKQFVATNEGPDSVRALYTFKEELEQSEDQQAKEVLVDVYDLLDFKKDAYELLCQRAVEQLSAAKALHDRLEAPYIRCMDFLKWQAKLDWILEELSLLPSKGENAL